MIYFRYHNTNCFFIRNETSGKLLAIDAGWPSTLYEYARAMKTIDCNYEDITWTIVTHFHMDHAGLITDFIEKGIRCFVFENQYNSIDYMEKTILKNYTQYKKINKTKLEQINHTDFNKMLDLEGFPGEVIITDYHSKDSISYVTEKNEAIVGDLPPIMQGMPDDEPFKKNWEMIKNKGIKKIYPSHAEVFSLEGY